MRDLLRVYKRDIYYEKILISISDGINISRAGSRIIYITQKIYWAIFEYLYIIKDEEKFLRSKC